MVKKNNFDKDKIEDSKNSVIKIIGVGNIYMSDDAIGIRVIEEIKKRDIFKLSKNIELIDGGTSGLDLIYEFKEADFVIIVDAVDGCQNEGEIILFEGEDIVNQNNKAFTSLSLHDIGLLEVFSIYKSLNIKTKIKIIGIKPKLIKEGDKLSKEIEDKIEEIIKIIIEIVNNIQSC